MKTSIALSALLCLLAVPNPVYAMGKKAPSAKKLCGDFEGVLKIPEISVQALDSSGAPIAPPAYATVWVYNGDHSTLAVPDDAPIILPFAYDTYKPIPMPLRLNDAGTGYVVGPMDLKLEKKHAGFAGTAGTCRQWIWRMSVQVNPSPWECASKACNDRDGANPDFFLGPNGPVPFKGLPPVTPSALEKYRPELFGQEVTLLEDASEYGGTYADYLTKTTKVVANTRAKLDSLARAGVTLSLKKAEALTGRGAWMETTTNFLPGIELADEQAYYSVYAQQSQDLYYRCMKFAALEHRSATVYGRVEQKWPLPATEGYLPGGISISGLDAETWAFCREKLRAGAEPDWTAIIPSSAGVLSFARLLNSRASGADVRRVNISGRFEVKPMANALEPDQARGVGVHTNLGWEPILQGLSKDDMDCLIDKANDGGFAELSAFQSVDRATGLPYLRLARLDELCIHRR